MENKKLKRRMVKVAERVGESKKYKGLYKYSVDIEETNGSITNHVSYGKDLQDVLLRIVHQEKVEKVTNKIEKIPYWIIGTLIMLYISAVVILYSMSGAKFVLIGGFLCFSILTSLFIVWVYTKNKKVEAIDEK